MVVKSAALAGASAAGYSEVYREASRAAESAIDRSELPLAERFMVKRYFELIAPSGASAETKEKK